jgi:glutathione S-transferase
LIPADPEDRIRMFGLANELMGEDGLCYCKRHFMTSVPLASLAKDSPARAGAAFLGEKYGYSEDNVARASSRIVEILEVVGAQLAAQHACGSRYLVGGQLSALDIYWATTCGFFDPMPEDRCPIATEFRQPHRYGSVNDEIDHALTAELRAHRDFIYETHLQLPIVF